jgi:CDP-paratose 2-epimerase
VKVVVTGGLGVIGSRFVDSLQPGETFIIDKGTANRHDWVAKRFSDRPKTMICRSDVCDFDWPSILTDPGGPDLILHAAAHTGIPHSVDHPEEDWSDNVEATRVILEGMRRGKSRATLVVLSSVKPYRVPADGLLTEETPLEPDEPYAASKMAQSGLVMAYARSYGLKATVLRCSNLYGDAPCHGPRHGWLTWACIAGAIGEPFWVEGDGQQSRDMLFCEDVTRAVFSAAENIETTAGSVYNIGGGIENMVSVSGAVRFISKHLREPMRVESAPSRPMDDRRVLVDFSRFRTATGWTPTVGVESGIEKIVRWALKNADDLRKIYENISRSTRG